MNSAISGGGVPGITQTAADARYLKQDGSTTGATSSQQAFTGAVSTSGTLTTGSFSGGINGAVIYRNTSSATKNLTETATTVALASRTVNKDWSALTANRTIKYADGTMDLAPLVTPTGTGNAVLATSPSLTTPTLVQPTLADFSNAQHGHSGVVSGGLINADNCFVNGISGDSSSAVALADNPNIAGGSISGAALLGCSFSNGITSGSGFQHVRTASNATGALVSSVVDTTVTWPVAFADTSYTVVATIDTPTGTPSVISTKTKTTTTCVVTIINLLAGAASGTLNVIAVHD